MAIAKHDWQGMSTPMDTGKVVPLRPPPRDVRVQVSHHEFGDLDFFTSPPSPIHMRLLAVICAVFACVLTISCIAKIDIYSIAQARIHPAGRSKFIQPLATGKVSAIHVANGAQVKKGDLLVEFDSTESTADRAATSEQYNAQRAEIERRLAANAAVRDNRLTPAPIVEFSADIPPDLRSREQQVLAADLSSLRSRLQALAAKIAENTTRKAVARAPIAEQERVVAALQQRFDMAQSLLDRGLTSKASVIDAEQSLSVELTDLAELKGQLQNAEAAIQSGYTETRHAIAEFIASNTQALASAQARRDEVAQSLVKALARFEHTRLIAPIDGTVQELAVTTIGQVVASGQHLLTVVPNDAALEAEALVSNKDIGFIEPGQRAVLKLDAFPFTRYGTLSGKITRISHDAMDSTQALSLANGLATNNRILPATQTQDLVYVVTVALDRGTIVIDNKAIPLLPGMTGRLEIRTGERRAIEYFFSPIVEVVSEAGHER